MSSLPLHAAIKASKKPVEIVLTVFFKDDKQFNNENPIVPELAGNLETDVDASLADDKAVDMAVVAVLIAGAGEIDGGGPLLCLVCPRSSFLWDCPLWDWRVHLSCRHLVWRPAGLLQTLQFHLDSVHAF